MSQGPYTNLNS